MSTDEPKDDKAPASAPDKDKPEEPGKASNAWGDNMAPSSESTPSEVLKRSEEKK